MSTSEILDELPKLQRADREKVWQRLEELELAETIETPETLEALEVARLAILAGRTTSPSQAHALVSQWTGKSS